MIGKKVFVFALCFVFMSVVLLATLPGSELQDRERIRENIHTLRLLRMTQALDLTEEQTTKIFPVMNRIEKEKIGIQWQIGLKMAELKSMLREKTAKEEEILSIVGSIKDLRQLLRSKDDELESFMEGNLTVIQKAKYLVFSVEFSRGLGETLERARMIRDRALKKEKRNF